ncbi:hypothetical protein N7468_001559 [Penicillium chermesinum]|uniref:Uncharacterized protein n=1 Tax=Penicillium chermesinum TaxID=63820 RepID=A0A9W9TWN7_9EURO|nr:uncharacterized protein N7468_001559 [Penicillium chermesinum]KAJ5246576.1 hypothetical protein N7468_001559 [Penicillium chermesinum]KAJ6144845.1 hypothetical protein N7470_008740 [Penicillium chermesinum]
MPANQDQLVPTVVDDEDVDHTDPVKEGADSDQQLARDEDEAIDQRNILPESNHSLRHAKPQTPAYSEGPSEDDLPKEVLEARY